ncbi:cupredoxin family copper-binding protein [Caballeronia sp. LP006]|jgi:plastocyanin|uniref:cupredoxin domain-containing protein n=1 Tax=unclassified Caballeronia TaxID=2646786 RepID=UPI0020295305|nr:MULTISPECIES: cupredoxin family copper-binding protein [unclassified Caballeronia]MDR5828706.1 cupredoxin family copper-binding protein [Caballeronia sp. LP006]
MNVATLASYVSPSRLRPLAGRVARQAAFALVVKGLVGIIPSACAEQPAQQMVAMNTPTISIDNFAFSQPSVTVPVGTKVTWVNHDDMLHTVADEAKSFKSDPLDSGQSYSHVFDKPGTYKYFCSLHPHMTGTIVVQ